MNSRAVDLLQKYWGEKVRRARGLRSQTWLARKAGVDQTTISRIERGSYNVSTELMIAIAVALELDVDDLWSYPPGLTDIARATAS